MKNTDCISRGIKERMSKLREAYRKWDDTKAFYLPLLTALENLGIEPTFEGEVNVSFSGDKEKVLAVFRLFRQHGWKHGGNGPEKNSPSWCDWWYSEKKLDLTPIWMSFNSTVCRRVKIGTKTVEQDVYETVCGEVEIPQASEPVI